MKPNQVLAPLKSQAVVYNNRGSFDNSVAATAVLNGLYEQNPRLPRNPSAFYGFSVKIKHHL